MTVIGRADREDSLAAAAHGRPVRPVIATAGDAGMLTDRFTEQGSWRAPRRIRPEGELSMQSLVRSCRRQSDGPRWTTALREQLAILRETQAAARLIRRDFGLSSVQDIESLVKLVARRRGKPISVLYLALPSRVSAFCIATPERDFIAVDANASELTQMNAIAHELGHFLFDDAEDAQASIETGHDSPLPEDLAQQLAPALNPDAVTAFFKRSHYDSRIERKVEAFATVMLERKIALRQPDNGLASTFTHRRTGV